MQTAYVLVSPCKDEARYIERTLKSIERQTVKPVQWVIVDDGSTDDGMAIVERYRERMPFIKVIHRSSGARAPLTAGSTASESPSVSTAPATATTT